MVPFLATHRHAYEYTGYECTRYAHGRQMSLNRTHDRVLLLSHKLYQTHLPSLCSLVCEMYAMQVLLQINPKHNTPKSSTFHLLNVCLISQASQQVDWHSACTVQRPERATAVAQTGHNTLLLPPIHLETARLAAVKADLATWQVLVIYSVTPLCLVCCVVSLSGVIK